METKNYESLSVAIDALTKEGYTEDFKAEEKFIKGLYSKKEYNPEDLKIIATYRFEVLSDPDDQTVLYVIQANDGTKGTLAAAYNAQFDQNDELIRKIKSIEIIMKH